MIHLKLLFAPRLIYGCIMTPLGVERSPCHQDLEEIWLYSMQQWGVRQADKYVGSLLARFSWLAENPYSGKHRDDIKTGYYCFPEGKHLVFYKLIDTGIDIIGVPHHRMDVVNYFADS
jgi:toxin ParE1/3/4